ncbi:MAG: tRNA (adenosine(37)-N6)-threonylcarbamoyltransferase complex dimerization subunit type 1 TsaB, partial [Candidatus Dadabacteria bacterium]|nr:tRNA (adenosine(37)-N6)-threonylcarbamoyltransferase complex dimerization subunit type 1 TsaB [Candidatus Dadabacteria bacterium]
MKILGIETSTFWGSVSVCDDDTILCEYVFNTGPRHNEVLIPTIERLLSDCGLGKDDLEAVCVSVGPGSFTSLRIGVSTAKTLCYSLGTDLAGIPSLEILASNALWCGDDV